MISFLYYALFWLESDSPCPSYQPAWQEGSAQSLLGLSPPWVTQMPKIMPNHQFIMVTANVLIIQALWFSQGPVVSLLLCSTHSMGRRLENLCPGFCLLNCTRQPSHSNSLGVELINGTEFSSSMARWLSPFPGSKTCLLSLALFSKTFLCLPHLLVSGYLRSYPQRALTFSSQKEPLSSASDFSAL